MSLVTQTDTLATCPGPQPVSHASGKPVEQLAVERLVSQLIEDAPDIFVGDSVVARLGVPDR